MAAAGGTKAGLPAAELERVIQWGLLILVTLMPFHAFLSVWLGKLIGHRTIIQSWKEVLLCGLVAMSIMLIIRQPQRLQRLNHLAPIAVMAFGVVALVVTLMAHPPWLAVLFGLKTDGEFLAAFLIAMLVATPDFLKRLVITTLVAGSVVVGFGLLQTFALPPDFLTWFGYGPDTIMPYLHLDPAVESLRFASTLGGPNQLGTYLIIILTLSLVLAWRRRQWWLGLLALTTIPVLISTYSRSAWLGALVALVVVVVGLLPQRLRRPGIGALAALGLLTAGLLPYLLRQGSLQYYVLHSSAAWHGQRGSDYEHLTSLQNGIHTVTSEPVGHGLGTAGPAVFHTGAGQIIENYYLQLGYEVGLAGMFLFIIVIGTLLIRLWQRGNTNPAALALTGALAGISVTALVLPAWTDSTTALMFWILAGVTIGLSQKELARVPAN